MRSQNRYLVAGLIAVALFAFAFAGCGDDSTTTSTPTGPPVQGSLDDPEFVVVQEQINVLADSVVTYFLHALSACQGLANEAIPVQYIVSPNSNNQLETDYAGGWHEINWTLIESSGLTTIVDSIQFLKGNSPHQSPLGAQSVTFVHHWYFAGELNNVTDTTDGNCNLTISDLYASPSTVQGTMEHSTFNQFDVSGSTITRTYEADVELYGFELPQAADGGSLNAFDNLDNCPLNGTVEADITMTHKVDNGSTVTTTWDIEVEFTNGAASVEVISNNTIWNYDCTVCAI